MLDGLAGIIDERSSPDGRLIGATVEGVVSGGADVITSGGLVAARAPARGSTSDGTSCLLVGRVYNAASLARELGLRENAATERVVEAAYDRDGTSALARLSGAFVLLLWNRSDQRGAVACDQLGTRSLYYKAVGSRLWFASDVNLLLRLLPRRPAPDDVALVHWLANSDIPENRTLYEGIKRVGAGHCLELEGDRWRRMRYWSLQYEKPARRSRSELVETLWDATTKAVHARLADGPVGIVMSGGIDSSTVAAAAATAPSGPPHSGYSAVFPGDDRMDESRRITLVMDALRIPSVQIAIEPAGAFALSLDYLDTWDVPLSGSGYLLEQPLLARAAEDGVVAVIDGQGGDELFGLSPYLFADRLRQGRLISSIKLARRVPTMLERRPWASTFADWKVFGLKPALPHGLHGWLRQRRVQSHAPPWLSESAARVFADSDDRWAWRREGNAPLWWLYKVKILTQDRERVGLAEYLRHRAAMAGIEARPPLMDIRLIEAALRVPPHLDFDPKYDRPLIREALKGRIPDEVRLWRRKSNLGPFYHQAVSQGDLHELRSLLSQGSLEISDYFDVERLRGLLERPPKFGERGWLHWLPPVWMAATAECWLRQQADADFARNLGQRNRKGRPRWRVHQETGLSGS